MIFKCIIKSSALNKKKSFHHTGVAQLLYNKNVSRFFDIFFNKHPHIKHHTPTIFFPPRSIKVIQIIIMVKCSRILDQYLCRSFRFYTNVTV